MGFNRVNIKFYWTHFVIFSISTGKLINLMKRKIHINVCKYIFIACTVPLHIQLLLQQYSDA